MRSDPALGPARSDAYKRGPLSLLANLPILSPSSHGQHEVVLCSGNVVKVLLLLLCDALELRIPTPSDGPVAPRLAALLVVGV